MRTVAGRLTQARLLTTDDDGVHLAHEALITCWPRLREWIDADRERLRHHRQLTDAARTWLEHDRDPGTLYRGTRLARAEELFAGDDGRYDGLTSEETAFLIAATEQQAAEERAATRARRRNRTLAASLCAVLAVALVVGLTAVRLRQDSEKQTTDTAARRVAAVADALRTTDPRTAMLLGVAAWRTSELPESRRALLGALAQPELGTFTDPAPGDEPNRILDTSGRTLLSIGDNTWRTWDVGTHRRIASGPVPHGALLGAGPGGRVLVIQTAQQTQRLWGTRTRRWIGDPLPFRDTVSFGTSGRDYLVRSMFDDRAGLYSVTDGHLVFRTPSAGSGELAHAAADDRLLAVCPRGRAPQVWDTSARRVRPGAWTSARGVCGDGAFLGLTGGRLLALAGGRVRAWDTTSGRQLADVAHPGALSAVASADGAFLATGGGEEIRVWRLPNSGAPVCRHSLANESLSGLAWDSSRPLLRYLEGGTVHTLDLTTTLTRAWRRSPLAGIQLSPDGRRLATAERVGDRYVFQLRNTRDGRLLRTLPAPPRPVFRTGTPTVPGEVTEPLLSFGPDGGMFAYGVSVPVGDTASQRLTVWDVAAGHTKATVDLATVSATPTNAIALGPGGRTLLTTRVTEDGLVNETWDVMRQRRTALLPGRADGHLAVSRDGRLLVTDNRVVRAGQSHAHVLVQHDAIEAIAFAPDGSGLAAGDVTGRVAVWDGDLRHRAGILRNVFPAPVDPATDSAETITALAFSPDGNTLAVGGDAGTVRLWDIETQQPLGTSLSTPGESIYTLAFSPDSTMLYAGGRYVPLHRYVVDPDRAVALVCARAGNAELTRAQWRTYVPDRPYRRICP